MMDEQVRAGNSIMRPSYLQQEQQQQRYLYGSL